MSFSYSIFSPKITLVIVLQFFSATNLFADSTPKILAHRLGSTPQYHKVKKQLNETVKDFFKSYKYDSISTIVDFLEHYEREKDKKSDISILEAHQTYVPSETCYITDKHQGHCVHQSTMLVNMLKNNGIYAFVAKSGVYRFAEKKYIPDISHAVVAVPLLKGNKLTVAIYDPSSTLQMDIIVSANQTKKFGKFWKKLECTTDEHLAETFCGIADELFYFKMEEADPLAIERMVPHSGVGSIVYFTKRGVPKKYLLVDIRDGFAYHDIYQDERKIKIDDLADNPLILSELAKSLDVETEWLRCRIQKISDHLENLRKLLKSKEFSNQGTWLERIPDHMQIYKGSPAQTK